MCWHKWSKWEQYDQRVLVTIFKTGKQWKEVESWQKRKCKKCDYEQRKEVKDY